MAVHPPILVADLLRHSFFTTQHSSTYEYSGTTTLSSALFLPAQKVWVARDIHPKFLLRPLPDLHNRRPAQTNVRMASSPSPLCRSSHGSSRTSVRPFVRSFTSMMTMMMDDDVCSTIRPSTNSERTTLPCVVGVEVLICLICCLLPFSNTTCFDPTSRTTVRRSCHRVVALFFPEICRGGNITCPCPHRTSI